MKRGDKVWVCQDGKFGRRVEGTVVRTKQGHHVQVSFSYVDDEENSQEVLFWVRLRSATKYRYKTYAGWADVDVWSPWYTVRKQSDCEGSKVTRIIARWELEEAFADFKKRGSNGKHKWNPKRDTIPLPPFMHGVQKAMAGGIPKGIISSTTGATK